MEVGGCLVCSRNLELTKNELIELIKHNYPSDELINIDIFEQYGECHKIFGNRYVWITDELKKLSKDELKTLYGALKNNFYIEFN